MSGRSLMDIVRPQDRGPKGRRRRLFPAVASEDHDDEFKRRWLEMGEGVRRSPEAHAELADARPPAWLGLSPKEIARAKEFMARVADRYPAWSEDELVWCLLAEATRKRKRGRKPIWLGIDGLVLVSAVNVELRSSGAKRSDPKAVVSAIARIKTAEPERYGDFSEQRLRDAYYDALPHASFFVGSV